MLEHGWSIRSSFLSSICIHPSHVNEYNDTPMNTSNIAINASQVKESSKHVFLAYLPPLLASFIWKPIKFLCLRAVPLTISYLYTSITYILYYLIIMLRWALVPVLFPLELFIWKPFMAVLMIVYQVGPTIDALRSTHPIL